MSWKTKKPLGQMGRGAVTDCPWGARASEECRPITANQLRVDRSSWWGGLSGRFISGWGGSTASGIWGRGGGFWGGGFWGGGFRGGRVSGMGCRGHGWGGWGGDGGSGWLATDEQNQRQQSEVLLHGNLPQSARANCCESYGAVPTNFLSLRETHVLSCGLSARESIPSGRYSRGVPAISKKRVPESQLIFQMCVTSPVRHPDPAADNRENRQSRSKRHFHSTFQPA